jgi:hypothetical protein
MRSGTPVVSARAQGIGICGGVCQCDTATARARGHESNPGSGGQVQRELGAPERAPRPGAIDGYTLPCGPCV